MTYGTEEALPLGTTVHGRYRTLAIVGRGGVGTVYKVADALYGATYALKELANPSPSARKQFENEAQWLQALNHPNIPKVREFFEWADRIYLVMDFVDGENLEQMLARRNGRPLAEADVLSWALPICDALHYLHSQQPPILHRDVKPANIIVTPAGHPVLVDLGIAKEHLPGAGMTATFVKKAGTEGYAPPEQYTASGKTGPWSDVYGMGATLYELLTGTVPPTAVERVALDSPMQRPRMLNRALSPHIDEAVTRALALRPADRFQSMTDLARALRGEARPSTPVLGSAGPPRPARPITPPAGLSSLPRSSGGLSAPGIPGIPGVPGASAPSGFPGMGNPARPPGALGALPALDPPLVNPAPLPALNASFPSTGGAGNGAYPSGGRGVVLPPAEPVRGGPTRGDTRRGKRGRPSPAVAVAATPEAASPSAGQAARVTRGAVWVRWLVAVVVLLGVGAGLFAAFGLGLILPPDRSTPQATVTGYFTALSTQDYARAWQYTADSHNNPSAYDTFVANLKSDDNRLGRITSIGTVSIQQDVTGATRASVTVQRASSSTPVTYLLTVTRYDGNIWLIDSVNLS